MNPRVHPDPQEQHPIPIADMNAYQYDAMPVDPQLEANAQSQPGTGPRGGDLSDTDVHMEDHNGGHEDRLRNQLNEEMRNGFQGR